MRNSSSSMRTEKATAPPGVEEIPPPRPSLAPVRINAGFWDRLWSDGITRVHLRGLCWCCAVRGAGGEIGQIQHKQRYGYATEDDEYPGYRHPLGGMAVRSRSWAVCLVLGVETHYGYSLCCPPNGASTQRL